MKDELDQIGYDGEGDMVVEAVIAPGVIFHQTAADTYIDYDAVLLDVPGSKSRQYVELISRTKLFI